MESKSGILNYYFKIQEVEQTSAGRAEFLRDYTQKRGSAVHPLMQDIMLKTGKDSTSTPPFVLAIAVSHLVCETLEYFPSIPWLEMFGELAKIAEGPKLEVVMSPALACVKAHRKSLEDHGMSILSIVPANASSLKLFRGLFSDQDSMLKDMITYNLAEHFDAYLDLRQDALNDKAKGYRRFEPHLRNLIKTMLYDQPLSVDNSQIRERFFGRTDLGPEELYHRSVVNARRARTTRFLGSVTPVDMPLLPPGFISKYGNQMAQEIFTAAFNQPRYGLGPQGEELLRSSINHLSSHGFDWMKGFANSIEVGSNAATQEEELGKIDHVELLKQFLDIHAYRDSKDHESARIFGDLIMDTMPKELVAQALNTDKIRKRRYDHTGDSFYLNAMTEESSIQSALEEDLGL
jgi:hypothetical protein